MKWNRLAVLKEAATVLHLARSGRLILKAAEGSLPREGSILVDEKGRRTCKVLEIIGPVKTPYISCQPLTERAESPSRTKLFLSEERNTSERRFRDRRQSSRGAQGQREGRRQHNNTSSVRRK